MLILTLRNDKPLSEVGLFSDQTELAYISWEAHRMLAETIHHKIGEILQSQSKTVQDIEAIVVYKGPGSFTGLRIGHSVANALAIANGASIVSQSGDDWISSGIARLADGESEPVAIPDYGNLM